MLEGWLKQFLTANLALIDGMRQNISEISEEDFKMLQKYVNEYGFGDIGKERIFE